MALSASVLRLVSWLYTARCFTCAMTPVDWTPRMSATPSAPLRYGSSPNDSNARPQRGSRTMLTVGPRFTVAPLAASSAPTTSPYRVVAAVSQVAATAIGAGSCVTPVSPSATPAGPSSRFIVGTHKAPSDGIMPTYDDPDAPVTSCTCWATLSRDSTWSTRGGIGAVEPTHGQAADAACTGIAEVPTTRPVRTRLIAAAPASARRGRPYLTGVSHSRCGGPGRTCRYAEDPVRHPV